jgi:uncharacterized coiled-coil protein SlyX
MCGRSGGRWTRISHDKQSQDHYNQETLDIQQQAIDVLNDQVNYTEIAMKKLRNDVNTIIQETKTYEEDFEETKKNILGTNFAVSYITSKLILGKQMIQEATRQWKCNHLHA